MSPMLVSKSYLLKVILAQSSEKSAISTNIFYVFYANIFYRYWDFLTDCSSPFAQSRLSTGNHWTFCLFFPMSGCCGGWHWPDSEVSAKWQDAGGWKQSNIIFCIKYWDKEDIVAGCTSDSCNINYRFWQQTLSMREVDEVGKRKRSFSYQTFRQT